VVKTASKVAPSGCAVQPRDQCHAMEADAIREACGIRKIAVQYDVPERSGQESVQSFVFYDLPVFLLD
jgi:hypothetical protein